MLSKGDEYPLHQTAEPVAFAGTDRNFYDRYFFNGYCDAAGGAGEGGAGESGAGEGGAGESGAGEGGSGEGGDGGAGARAEGGAEGGTGGGTGGDTGCGVGGGFFAMALGIYPHLDVADAHFCFIRGGDGPDAVQYNLHASRELGQERMDLQVGPITLEIIEPLKRLKILVDDGEGIAAEIVFTARAFPIEEPRFTHRIGPRTFMDYTRMTQNGSYEGWVSVDGVRQEISSDWMGTRDRSWGVRPIGARDPQPMPGVPAPQFFWQWTPINLTGGSLFFHINAGPDGDAWNSRAAWVPNGGGVEDIIEGEGRLIGRLLPGTRWPSGGRLELDFGSLDSGEGVAPGQNGAPPKSLELTPIQRFQMRGLGYTSPEWGHGLYHGALRVAREDLTLSDLQPLSPENLHVQQICRVTSADGDQTMCGLGAFEQLILGPYSKLGLSEYLDGGT